MGSHSRASPHPSYSQIIKDPQIPHQGPELPDYQAQLDVPGGADNSDASLPTESPHSIGKPKEKSARKRFEQLIVILALALGVAAGIVVASKHLTIKGQVGGYQFAPSAPMLEKATPGVLNWLQSLQHQARRQKALQVPRHGHSLGLPTIEEAEQTLPPRIQQGKRFLAEAIADVKPCPPLSPPAKAAIRILARTISRERDDNIIGMTISLINAVSLNTNQVSRRQRLEITDVLGWDETSVTLGAREQRTGAPVAVRFFFKQLDEEGNRKEAVESGLTAIREHAEIMKQVCKEISGEYAAVNKGIVVPIYFADIASGFDSIISDRIVVFANVQVMERLETSLSAVFSVMHPIPAPAKEYAARRLLLEVLHLQEAGVSHNDIRLERCFVRQDGSFLLGGLECGNVFYKRREHQLSAPHIDHVDPALVVALQRGYEGAFDPKSDMWSLGTSLYQIFMNGDIPYVSVATRKSLGSMIRRAEELMTFHPSEEGLRVGMSYEKVPERWQDLICGLLQPQLDMRLGAKEIVEEFSDLFED